MNQEIDPRDAAKMQEEKTQNDSSGNMLPSKNGGVQFKNKFGTPPPVDNTPKPTWVFSDKEKEEWQSSGTSFDIETPIGHAWARLLNRDIQIGPPITNITKISQNDEPDLYRQLFQHATAFYVDDASKNPNLIVEFTDARGIVGTDSGI